MACAWKLLVLCQWVFRPDPACGSVQLILVSPPCSRSDSSITCTMPAAELTAAVPVCVQFENKSCASHNITFKYEKNPVISDINPKKSQIR